VACAVTLYEAYRQKNKAGHYNQAGLDSVIKQDLLKEWSIYEENN
jgi:tRNA (guanosine-2'-O-)-methyltransferase